MFEVLLFLLDHYDDAEHCPGEWQMVRSLVLADFENEDIARALLWIGQLSALEKQTQFFAEPQGHAIRSLTDSERSLLDADCLGLLTELEQDGVLTPADREAALASLTLLAGGPLARPQWLILVLFTLWRRNRTPGKEKMRELLRGCQRTAHANSDDDTVPMPPVLP